MNRLTWDKDGYSQRVRVYWNLHTKQYSVQDCETGLVIHHTRTFNMHDAKFVVRNGGKERVRKEGRKNVHAFVVGRLASNVKHQLADIKQGAKRVTYNPYKYDSFVVAEDETPVTDAHVVTAGSWQGMPSMWAITTPNKSNIGLTNQQ